MLSQPIYNITPFTLLDYPDKSACIFWYAGCNMRCLYCYNPEIVLGKGTTTFSEAISFLKSRQGLLDAVVFSGGECLIHKNILDQIKIIKELGFLIKIDTNGSNPNVLKQLIERNLIDYAALDFKATKSNFQQITKSDLFLQFEMMRYLNSKNYTGNYFIQSFKNNVTTLSDLPFSDRVQEKNWLPSLSFNVICRN